MKQALSFVTWIFLPPTLFVGLFAIFDKFNQPTYTKEFGATMFVWVFLFIMALLSGLIRIED